MADDNSTIAKVSDDIQKFWLAITFLLVCVGGILLLSVMVIKAKGDKDALEAAKSIFNSILPLLGAWVGAILAYYFGTKQIESSQQQQARTLEVVQRQAEDHRAMLQQSQQVILAQMQQLDVLRQGKDK